MLLLGLLLLTGLTAGQEGEVTTAEALDYTSCASRCDEAYFPGRPCYCNSACDQYENCCFDYYTECKPEYIWSDEWSTFNGHAYKFFADTQVTGEQAVRACRGHRGLLVSINSPEEQQFISDSVLRRRALSAFSGATDKAKEGVWKWADGTEMNLPTATWHFWFPGQPDNADDSEDCSIMTNYLFWAKRKRTLDEYNWMDYSCVINPQEIQGYVCERTLDCEPNPCQNGGTCLYVGISEKFLCECTEGYVGIYCQIQLSDGETWTQCGETLLTSDTGSVISPLYPRDYPPNVACEWRVSVGAGNTISMTIQALELESSKDCTFDSLTIYDGSSDSGATLLGPVCGNLRSNASDALTLPYSTSGPTALIVFSTDSSVHGTGFRLIYKADRCGRGSGDSGCGGVPRTFTTDCGHADVTRGPSDGTTCQWDLLVEDGRIINLTITDFQLPDTGADCSGGSLTLYDGSISPSHLLNRACGRRVAWSTITTTNKLYLRLDTPDWEMASSRIAFQYTSIDQSEWKLVNPLRPTETERDQAGSLSAASTPVYVETGDQLIYLWWVRAPIGDRLLLTWKLFSTKGAAVQIYDGHSQLSRLAVMAESVGVERTGDVKATTFQLFIRVTSNVTDERFTFDATHQAIDWQPELSNCYRPLYRQRTDSVATENSVVLPDQPVILMVAETAFSDDSGYDNGLYCKWEVRGEPGTRLTSTFLDFDVPPNDPSCATDGFVIRDPSAKATKGQFCGASPSLLQTKVMSSSNVLEMVFYSDTMGSRREGGILRALVTTDGANACEFHQMETANSQLMKTTCGVVLSPWFLGLVPPGLWTWTLEAIDYNYFVVNVHYVRAPGITDDCSQFFQLVEMSIDFTKLRQYEGVLFKVCASEKLRVPEYRVRNPPRQKMTIELSTIKSALYQRWEFKVSYSSAVMVPPQNTNGPPGACPTKYTYYKGNCYMYEQWVRRHYRPKDYSYQTTWQGSMSRCRKDGSDLLSIKDEEEAYFIKYWLANTWFWDTAATYQINHRTIYIGLTNRYSNYEWTDDVVQAYSDWFQPGEPWEQPIVHEDEQEKYDTLGLTSPEPKADRGSVCTAIVLQSPFKSLNWIKLPCDLPIFRAGLICKKPANELNATKEVVSSHYMTLRNYQVNGYKGCMPGWRMVGNTCLRLLTDYSLNVIARNRNLNGTLEIPPPEGITYMEAEMRCSSEDGVLRALSAADLEQLKLYLAIWRHDMNTGGIWLERQGTICRALEVYKMHRLSEEMQYRLIEGDCEEIRIRAQPYNALCQKEPIVLKEDCQRDEFKCANGVCISVDYVCDGTNDCFDNSDEEACQDATACGNGRFMCGNGNCISLSLFCDRKDNCGDGSDEATCVMETCTGDQFRCRSGQCVSVDVICDFRRDCFDGSDEDADTCDGNCRGFQCFSGRCLPSFLQHDIISDCPGLALEDEIDKNRDLVTLFDILDETASVEVQNKSFPGCSHPGQAQCHPDYDACFDRSKTCIYDTFVPDEGLGSSVQAYCRDGSHLRMSCGGLLCPGMFVCPDAYCLPYSKVCDGRLDCPGGQDEDLCQDYICPGLFHCKGESYCIPHEKICDGQVHCTRYMEDEKYCGLTDILCQDACVCTGNVAVCTNQTGISLPAPARRTPRHLRSIVVSGNNLELENVTFSGLHWLGKLNLSHSGLSFLPGGVFQDLANLFELDLSSNRLEQLDPAVFNGLVSLRLLTLHRNRLGATDSATFSELKSLRHLIITANPLTDVTQDAFVNVPTLHTLNSDAFKFCCIAKQVALCTPEPDEFSSCEDLMANSTLQLSIWVLGFFAFAGNLFVVIWRVKTDRAKVSSFFIISLGCSDFFMGVYMLIIASVDSFYRGQYILYAEKWRSSTLCQVAGILAMLSSEVSVFMLTVITADRLFVILFPLKKGKFRMTHARYVVLGGWSVCFFLSVLPALGIPYFGNAFFGRTGVCLPFQMNNDQQPGWEYSVLIFLCINLISFVFILVAYTIIFMSVKSAAKKMGDKSTSATDEYSLAKKLMLIVATDLICWMPIILIGFAGLGGARIPAQVSAWIAVFVLPLNSAVNPILYTMSAIDCSGRRKKRRPTTSATSTMKTGVSETSMTQANNGRTTNGSAATNGANKV